MPSVARLKFQYFGHDGIVLHEREIRRGAGAFSILQNKPRREAFLDDITNLVASTPVVVVASVIQKTLLRERYTNHRVPTIWAFCSAWNA